MQQDLVNRASAESPNRGLPLGEPMVGNYFVAAYPPFAAWSEVNNPALFNALNQPPRPDIPLGLYVHIPFCAKKCDYCYYVSYTAQRRGVIDNYIDCLIQEAGTYGSSKGVAERPLRYVYLGGGTPSILSGTQLEWLMDGLKAAFNWNSPEEFSFEVAPRSVRPELLDSLKHCGVTRISMGVQSLDDEILELNGRIHLKQDTVRAFHWLREKDFFYINLDLMAGLLGETPDKWKSTVREAIQMEPESITVYQTEIPYNTQLYRNVVAKCTPSALISWEEKRHRLDYAFNELDRAGYHVVSAYTAVKDPAKHRFLYQDYLWNGADMLACGIAAFGYFGGIHFQNQTSLESYTKKIQEGTLPLLRSFALSPHDQLVREFILQLKLGEVSCAKFEKKFGVNPRELFEPALHDLEAAGLLTVTPSTVRTTAEGILQVDRFLPLFYDLPYQTIRYT